jgi:hypothetical protein
VTKLSATGVVSYSTYAYTYDTAGNRLTVSVNGGTPVTTTYNEANQVSLAAWNYDLAGNLTSDGTTSSTYDALNRLLTTSRTGQSRTNTYAMACCSNRSPTAPPRASRRTSPPARRCCSGAAGVGSPSCGSSFTSKTQLHSVILRCFHVVWERDIERGPMPNLSFGRDGAAMPLHDALDIGQTNARALELVHAVEPLKDAEELITIAHIEPDTVITNKEECWL